MRFLLLIAFALPLLAEDKAPPTIAQLQAEIAQLKEQLAKSQRKLGIYQQASFQCQDAALDKQLDEQKQPKPEGK